MENEKMERTVRCSDCGAVVSWLAVFPLGRCVDCHAVSEEGRRVWSASDLRRAFEGAK